MGDLLLRLLSVLALVLSPVLCPLGGASSRLLARILEWEGTVERRLCNAGRSPSGSVSASCGACMALGGGATPRGALAGGCAGRTMPKAPGICTSCKKKLNV